MFNDFYHVGFDYMSFSYFLLPSILIIFEYFLENNKNYIFIYIPSIILLLIFGARGAFLSLIITSLILFFNSKWSKKIKYMALIILIFLIIIVSFQLDLILTRLDLILSSIGINSYSVNQYINILQGDLIKASAGRTELYIKSIELIKNKLFFGGGFTYFNEHNQLMTYPHNIFLEIGLQFGLIGLLMFFILNIKLVFNYFIINNYHFKVLFIILFVSSFIRLNFSMSFWETTFFWASIGLSLNAQNYNK
jgi:O-antigen ligase